MGTFVVTVLSSSTRHSLRVASSLSDSMSSSTTSPRAMRSFCSGLTVTVLPGAANTSSATATGGCGSPGCTTPTRTNARLVAPNRSRTS